MHYENVFEAEFISRPNRFVAEIKINGKTELAHVKNTGRCRELFIPGARLFVQKAHNPNRKTPYMVIAVYKGDCLINIDSVSPNAAVYEAVSEGRFFDMGKPDVLKREVRFGASRFDLYFEKGERRGFIEVKGVTLERDGIALFPDAPTERGSKHICELIKAKEAGFEACICFVVQLAGVKYFTPNAETDKAFAENLKKAKRAGVNIIAVDCTVTENSIKTDKPLPVKNIE